MSPFLIYTKTWMCIFAANDILWFFPLVFLIRFKTETEIQYCSKFCSKFSVVSFAHEANLTEKCTVLIGWILEYIIRSSDRWLFQICSDSLCAIKRHLIIDRSVLWRQCNTCRQISWPLYSSAYKVPFRFVITDTCTDNNMCTQEDQQILHPHYRRSGYI